MESDLEKLVTLSVTQSLKEADTACLYAYCKNEETPRYHEFHAPGIQCIVIIRENEIVLIKVVCYGSSAIVMKDHPGHFSGIEECFLPIQRGLFSAVSQFHMLQYLQCYLFRSVIDWL